MRYFGHMPELLSAADLVLGRSGGVSVAEYAAASVASICIPYPHHRDRHQYSNTSALLDAGAAVLVEDLPDAGARAEAVWKQLEPLMLDKARRERMAAAAGKLARQGAAEFIANKLLEK
jgi:UDP-N-acetylglucosamine--N-acetylmuramyl-(pentapeptide) pyrophosphoryl-undecaprenol N-acetylglucosamine transferase